MAPAVVALLTDFGLRDTYVGELKGAFLAINPAAALVDLTHDGAPGDVAAGARMLADAAAAFAPGTVFVGVVDPGVGSDRRAILVETPQGAFIGPDNGLFSGVVWGADAPGAAPEAAVSPLPVGVAAWRLTNPAYWRAEVSNTFHGRDVFAPVAAHYTLGVPGAAMGSPLAELWRLPSPTPSWRGGVLAGAVVHVDRFGNLVTNIPAERIAGNAVVEVGGQRIEGLSAHYDPALPLVAIVGSHGTLEVAKPGGSAAAALGLGVGDTVRVR